jgi:hypothetical protein
MRNSTLLGVACALALAGCATPRPTESISQAAFAGPQPPPCVQDTGTRLPVKAQDCAGFGQTFTQHDLQRTGAMDTAGALQLLSPSLLIQGH